jgi:threonine/homoserine/homoserine lactone efflux protein
VDWNSLAQFTAATLLVLITPGPVMAIIAHNTLRHGAMAGLSTVIGLELGEVCLLGAISTGLMLAGEFLPVLFRWLSLVGAFYLIWLAAGALRLRDQSPRNPNFSCSRMPILDGLTIAFANPAALAFYAAFFPQFIDPDQPILGQMIALGAIYVCIALAFDSACVLTVARLRLPAAGTRIGMFANLGSAIVYLSIALITVLSFIAASG